MKKEEDKRKEDESLIDWLDRLRRWINCPICHRKIKAWSLKRHIRNNHKEQSKTKSLRRFKAEDEDNLNAIDRAK